MRKKDDFESGMGFGPIWPGKSRVSETADLQIFSHTTIFRLSREQSEKRKYPIRTVLWAKNPC